MTLTNPMVSVGSKMVEHWSKIRHCKGHYQNEKTNPIELNSPNASHIDVVHAIFFLEREWANGRTPELKPY